LQHEEKQLLFGLHIFAALREAVALWPVNFFAALREILSKQSNKVLQGREVVESV
jgi:hypothetical protein